MKACLIVHEVSAPYIRNVAATLIESLQDVFSSESRMVISSSVDSADIGDAELIFVIGENIDRFKRLAGRRYIYLNFSVVTMLGNPFKASVRGIRMIHHKSCLLKQKLDLFDALLDYYPPQTHHLVKSLNLPVVGFVPWVNPVMQQHVIPLKERPYDVCFVGAPSARRERILKKLKAAGCVLSPSSGVVAEDIAGQSRCTLNIHMQRSNHLEIPRVMGALAVSPLITEDSYGLHELLMKGSVRVVPYRRLVNETLALLSDSRHLEEIAEFARFWYCDVGAPRFKAIFISAIKEIQLICRAH